jgi:hypothetical protein
VNRSEASRRKGSSGRERQPSNRQPAVGRGARTRTPQPGTPAEPKPSIKQPALMADAGHTPDEQASGEASWWGRLSLGAKALAGLITTVAVLAAVPGVTSYVTDHVQDLYGGSPLQVDANMKDSTLGLYWATGAVVNAPVETALGEIARQGGAPAGYSVQELLLENRRAVTLYVTAIEPVDIERRPPFAGTLFGYPPQGEQANISLRLRLDAARPVPLDQASGQPFFGAKHIDLIPSEVQIVDVQSEALHCYCTWRLRITYRYRGKAQTIVVPPANQPPFQMTAFVRPQGYRVQYVSDGSSEIKRIDCATAKSNCAMTKLPIPPAT